MFDNDNCLECGSTVLKTRFLRRKDNKKIYEVQCRECYELWEDYEDE